MALDALLTPWTGRAYRHLPAGAPYDVLDFRYAGRGADNRWNEPGEPTLYLAGDLGVVIAEFGRHVDVHRDPALKSAVVERTVYRLEVAVERMIDLRDPRVCHALSLPDAPFCFMDIGLARATARYLRRATAAQALLAPSIAMLDKPERWIMALFLEKLPDDPARFISAVLVEGPLRWR